MTCREPPKEDQDSKLKLHPQPQPQKPWQVEKKRIASLSLEERRKVGIIVSQSLEKCYSLLIPLLHCIHIQEYKCKEYTSIEKLAKMTLSQNKKKMASKVTR